jgi:small subunit ribosomal protein S1
VQVGDLVTGVVVKSASRFALVAVGGAECHLHESQVSGHAFKGMYKVLSVGEQVTALVIDFHLSDGQVELSTKDLERNPGDMLTNRQAVWDGAEEMAAQWRERQSLLTAAS